MWGQKQILTNFVIFCLIWPLYIVCYTSVLLELESIGGSLYLNMILCSFLEMMAAFLATYLSKFDCGKIIRIILSLLSFFFLLFIFAPVSLSKSSLALTVFFILMMLSGKICYDIICLLVYIYSPKILTDKYVPLFLIFSRFLSRFFNLFIPYINLFFKSFDLHPFVFLGIMWLVSRILISCTKEVQREGISDLINEFKISILHKLSVLSGGRSMASIPHDEFLKNITIKGQNLSMIKKSRFQSEFGLKDSRQGGISMSLLNNPTFVEYKSKYIAEEKD